jgi:hypothetical protein
MAAPGPVADGPAALAEGRWEEARVAFETALARGEAETGQACFGLAMALWWLGENHACVDRYSRAYALFRAAGDVEGRGAVWLAITYKSNFANFAAADGTLAAPFQVHVVRARPSPDDVRETPGPFGTQD